MENKITLEQCKILTEWLGECWKEGGWGLGEVVLLTPNILNRTFDNWTDFGAVVKSIGWKQTCLFVDKIPICDTEEIPERFCILVAEAIKEGEIK